jgi:hypothetical protein
MVVHLGRRVRAFFGLRLITMRNAIYGFTGSEARWRAAITPKIETDALTKAEAALQHFIKCVEVLPPDQAAPLWGEV